MEKLIENVQRYKMSQKEIDDEEKGRLLFIERFPKEIIPVLTIEEYGKLKATDTFTYWLERKRILFGIGGGNASKFGIYMAKDGQYYTSYGTNKILQEGDELELRFSSLKKGIVAALELTEQNKIDEIIKIDIPLWNMVLQKILCIYHPEKFIDIGSSDVLLKCARDIGLSNIDLSLANMISVNHECRKQLNAKKEFAEWNYAQLGTLVWAIYKPQANQKIPKNDFSNKNTTQYWLYAPGENAAMWDEFFDTGIMALGWEELGDLSNYSSKEEIASKLRESENFKGSQSINAKGNFDFKNNVNIGDVVIAKKGRTKYVGYGIVASDYYFDTDRADFNSCRKVNWIKKGNWIEENGSIALKTLTNITDLPTKVAGFDSYVDRLKHLIGMNETKPTSINFTKNTILYGPPGTGKTYNSIDKAVEIANGGSVSNHSDNKQIFDELRKQGQIEFVTFHQNYSYEDFVVGISPDVSAGQLRFEKREGIFKVLAERAKQNWMAANNLAVGDFDFDYVFNSFFSKLIEEEEKSVEIPMKKKGYSFKITSIDFENGRIKFTKQSQSKGHDLLINNVHAIYDGGLNYSNDGLGVYYYPLIDKLKEYAATLKPQETAPEELKNFVLIIDEINRANISKVFGELITLLEEDKRLGEPNELKVTLPNGEKDFGVPPNLYIIGTMNTADKSIALIDIALRRRFEFIGKYPEYGGLTSEEAVLLEKINTAIYEKKKSADFLIGHAYFMKNQPIETVLRNSVIPLLMEYFSGKPEIVSNIFNGSDWNVSYNSASYGWYISEA